MPEVKVLPVIIYLGYPMPMYWRISCSLHLLIGAVFVLYPGLSVNGMMLRVKAKELSTDPEFKASLGWYNDWKRRHSISMRTKTTLAQRLPADMEDKIVTFLHLFIFFRFVTYQITEHVLSSTYHIYANLTSLVGEFVYI